MIYGLGAMVLCVVFWPEGVVLYVVFIQQTLKLIFSVDQFQLRLPMKFPGQRHYLEGRGDLGRGDLVSRLIKGISRVTIWVIGAFNLHTKSP